MQRLRKILTIEHLIRLGIEPSNIITFIFFHMDKIEVVIIKNSSDPKKIGKHFPQTVLLNKKETDDLEFLSTQKGIRVPEKISLKNIQLSSIAKLTDAISCSLGPGNDMIISDRLYEIFKGSNVGPVQFLRSQKTVLLESFNHELDLFVLSSIDQNIYISKRIFNKMVECDITGLEYKNDFLQTSD